MEKDTAIILLGCIVSAAIFGGPGAAAFLLTLVAMGWLARNFQHAWVDSKARSIAGSHLIPIDLECYDQLKCELVYFPEINFYEIKRITRNHSTQDLFAELSVKYGLEINTAIEKYIKEKKLAAGLSTDRPIDAYW